MRIVFELVPLLDMRESTFTVLAYIDVPGHAMSI